MLSLMNEVEKAMYDLSQSLMWHTRCVTNGFASDWDGEWFYHLSEGGFKDIEWAEIKPNNLEHSASILAALKTIIVPGTKTENGFKIYGCVQESKAVDYL